jgi:hypothetical protein
MKNLFAAVAVVSLLAVRAAGAADQAPSPMVTKSGWASVNAWDGAYVSGALGLIWEHANINQSMSSVFNQTTIGDPFSGPGAVTTNIITSTLSGTANGRDRGIEAVFSVGYNFVFSSWLIGAQLDASWNRNKDVVTRMLGTNTNTNSQVVNSNVIVPGSQSTLATGVIDFSLQKNWTVSELARIGYFVTPKTLVYGGLGWSVSGFDLINNFGFVTSTSGCAAGAGADPSGGAAAGTCTFTMNGFTWTAGIEQDFGGWRGFLQFKGINYRAKDVIILGQNNGASSTNRIDTFVPITVSTVQGVTDVRHVSASTLELNAGITIPLGVAFNHWRT